MNTDSTEKQNRQWEVDRYLLADPTFDRNAFEQRMLEDLSLAELVAASVADLQIVSHAARVTCPSAISVSTVKPRQPSLSSSTAYRWAVLVAAAMFISVSVWQFRQTSKEAQLSQIVDNWVAIEGLTTADSLELIATEEQASDSDAETNEQSDWLVEAAREFYLAKNDGAAG